MTQLRWDVPGYDDDDQASTGRASPTLVSLHFIRSTLRRRWLICLLSPIIGLLAVVAFLVASPAPHDADASLVLAHDPRVEPSRAMATDVSLLRTRAVASETIASLGLTMTPDDFLKSVTAVPVSSELLTITLAAPTDAEAVRRLSALTTVYLKFRGEQLSLQSNALVEGIQQRISKLETEVADLSKRIEELTAAGSSSASKLSDTIAQRAYVQGRIEMLQQSVEDAVLQTNAVVSSSRVIDAAAAETGGVKKRIALAVASGLIGGAAFGCGLVLFFAIISDRLRRRSEIAATLEVPVPVSVRRIAPLSKRWLSLPHMRTLDSRRTDARQRLARAIAMELPTPGCGGRLAVACIDNADEVRFAFADAVADLATSGHSVAVIDLTEHGSLTEVAPSMTSSTDRTVLLRPGGIPSLASAPAELRLVGGEDGSPPSLELYDITLVLADLDPSVGADYLTAWTDRVFVVVTAGHSSVERVRTAADLVRAAGLDMQSAAVLRTERTDESFSAGSRSDRPAAVQLEDGHDQPLLDFEELSEDEERLAAEATSDAATGAWLDDDWAVATDPVSSDDQQELVATFGVLGAEPFDETDESQAADDEEAAAAEQLEEQHAAYGLLAIEEHDEAPGEQHDDTQQLAAIQEHDQAPGEQHDDTQQLAAIQDHDQAPEEQHDDTQQLAAIQDHDQAPEEQHDDTQQLAAIQDHDETPEEQHDDTQQLAAIQDHDETPEEQHDDTQQLAAIEQQEEAPAEQPIAEEYPIAEEQEETPEGYQIAEEQYQIAEEQPIAEEYPIAEEQEETPEEYQIAEEQPVAEEQQIADADTVQMTPVAELGQHGQNDQAVEPHHVAQPRDYDGAVDGWDLYIVKYPPTNAESAPIFVDDGFDWSWDWDLDDLDFKPDSTVVDTAEESEDESVTQADTEEDAQGGTDEQVGDRPRAFARARTRTRTRSRARRKSSRHK